MWIEYDYFGALSRADSSVNDGTQENLSFKFGRAWPRERRLQLSVMLARTYIPAIKLSSLAVNSENPSSSRTVSYLIHTSRCPVVCDKSGNENRGLEERKLTATIKLWSTTNTTFDGRGMSSSIEGLRTVRWESDSDGSQWQMSRYK